jgi:hypothetical protein
MDTWTDREKDGKTDREKDRQRKREMWRAWHKLNVVELCAERVKSKTFTAQTDSRTKINKLDKAQ